MRTLRFYFDYISTNAYLAWVRLPELRERFDLRIEPVPVLFAGFLEANGQLGQKTQQMAQRDAHYAPEHLKRIAALTERMRTNVVMFRSRDERDSRPGIA